MVLHQTQKCLYVSKIVTCICTARFCGGAQRPELCPAGPVQIRDEMGPGEDTTQVSRFPGFREAPVAAAAASCDLKQGSGDHFACSIQALSEPSFPCGEGFSLIPRLWVRLGDRGQAQPGAPWPVFLHRPP